LEGIAEKYIIPLTDRSYLRLTEQEFTSLPADASYIKKFSLLKIFTVHFVVPQIVLQTILSLLLTVFGVTMIAGEFKEIRSNIDLQKKYTNYRQSFNILIKIYFSITGLGKI